MITDKDIAEIRKGLEIDLITKKLLQLNDKVNEHRQAAINDVAAVKEMRSGATIENQIKQILATQTIMYDGIQELKGQVAGMSNSKKFIEIFGDKELYDLYDKSGMQLKEVAAKFNVAIQTASDYVQGKVQDPIIRSNLGMWLRNEIAKKK
jgi:chromosome segregation and condensation protein ScpB